MNINFDIKPQTREHMISAAIGVLVILLSTGFYFLSTVQDHRLFWLAWIASVPVLIFAFRTSSLLIVFTVALLSYLLANFADLAFLRTQFPLSIRPFFPFITIVESFEADAIFFAIGVTLTRYIVIKNRHWVNIFFLPAFWTVYEYFFTVFSSSGTNGSIAYSQMHWLPILQISSVTGVWGITFLLMLIPSSLAIAWRYQKDAEQAITSVMIPLLLFMAVAGWGYLQLRKADAPTQTITVGLASLNQSIHDLISTNPIEVEAVATSYAKLVHLLATRGAKIVVLPEKVVSTKPEYLDEVLAIFSEAAAANRVTLLVGIDQQHTPPQGKNSAFLFGPNGKLIDIYHKQKLLDFGRESAYQPGIEPSILTLAGGKAGIAICHDMDFPVIGREYSKAGIQLALVPALDFVADGWRHARIAILRGVEGGYPIVRAAQWGLLSVSDQYGNILAQKKTSMTWPTILIAKVPLGPGKETLYSKFSDWFAWFAMALAAFILLFSLFRGRNPGR